MKLTPTKKLILIALEEHHEMTLGQLCEFVGSSPYYLQMTTAKMTKHGLLTRIRKDGVNHYSIPTSTPPPAA